MASSSKSPFSTYPLHDNLKMAQLVSAGLPATSLLELSEALHLQPASVAPIVNINRKTIQRRLAAPSKNRLKPDESERVARLMRVFDHAVRVFASGEQARQWLARPLKLLGGQSPIALLTTEQGAREVEQVLGRLEHGVFS
jgi:putative toxin-antitoxin system antitoxin component (TIGR02293 family)